MSFHYREKVTASHLILLFFFVLAFGLGNCDMSRPFRRVAPLLIVQARGLDRGVRPWRFLGLLQFCSFVLVQKSLLYLFPFSLLSFLKQWKCAQCTHFSSPSRQAQSLSCAVRFSQRRSISHRYAISSRLNFASSPSFPYLPSILIMRH